MYSSRQEVIFWYCRLLMCGLRLHCSCNSRENELLEEYKLTSQYSIIARDGEKEKEEVLRAA
jgi:hypothetical protein